MQPLLSDDGFLVIGLGNPGLRYLGTRHNFGFMLLDSLQQKIVSSSSFEYIKSCDAEICSGKLAGKPVWLIKPQTFMNLSGRTVQAIFADLSFVDRQKIIVVHDDLDLPLGRIKLKKGGGDGGHNGVSSIIEALGCAGFLRMRLGINSPLRDSDTIDYVLSPFSEGETDIVVDVINRGVEGVLQILTSGVNAAMNQVNRRVLVPYRLLSGLKNKKMF